MLFERRGPLLEVRDTRRQGSRVYLVLSCGHEKLHNPRVDVPRRSYCNECPVSADA